jgi:hypothetical protein
MAFVSLTSANLQTGEPVKSEILTQIKDNEDDLNSRLSTVEGTSNVYPPLYFTVVGNGQVKDGLALFRVPFDIAILGVRMFIFEKEGTVSGTLTVDVEKYHSSTWSTILSSTISTSSGTLYTVNSGTLSVTSAVAGDLIRLNQDSVMTGCLGYQVVFEYEKA